MVDPIARLDAALAGRYSIEREIGTGGMATVYLADDLRHTRKVALKVLKPDLAAAVGDDRFLAEIRTTANLVHPNILPLFDSGTADGLLFYVMPFIAGDTLRHRIEREGRLSISEAARIAGDVAEGLHAAHERGIIHRDIKPANILLSGGRALVADFGIARAAEVTQGARLTQTGSSIGTAGYMSPEQAAGHGELDRRSDIYSLGCVLFEMLTGRPPYDGPSVLAVLSKQATEPVPAARALRPETPRGLERAVMTALAKDPDHRFRTAADFAAALSADAEAPSRSADEPTTVAVLPFVNQSPDPENEYFSDGLTEEVISDLSRVSALRVISRNSAMALKGTTKGTRTLARELGATHLVTGSVRRAGPALRVTAELVAAATDTPVWSDKFSGTVEDVFGIQEEIARQIVAALEVTLTDTEDRQVSERAIEDPLAYDCYLRARQEMYAWTAAAQDRALRLVDEALSIVGDNALLLAMKGQIYWSQVNIGLLSPQEGLGTAEELAERALALDPDSYLGIFVRGLVSGLRGQAESALIDLRRAYELRPGDANVLTELCRFANAAGLQSHEPLVDRAVQMDPLTPITTLVVSTWCSVTGRHREASVAARRAIALAGRSSMLHVFAAWQIAEAGEREEACRILRQAGHDLQGSLIGSLAFFLRHAFEGKVEEALGSVTPEMEMLRADHLNRMVADGYAAIGQTEEALRWVERAIGAGFINYPCLAEHDPFLAELRGDARLQALLDGLKPRWEAVVEWERSVGGLAPGPPGS